MEFNHTLISEQRDQSIFDTLIQIYKRHNISLEKSTFGDFLRPVGTDMGYSITAKEIDYLSKYQYMFNKPKIFIIGNAFGFSTFCFKLIFNNCQIDVIDAEAEGASNVDGSELTKNIIKENNWDINLYIGTSPKDIKSAMRFAKYDIVFIDGYHSNEQITQDFNGISPYLSTNYIVFLHDMGLAKLHDGFRKILNDYERFYDKFVFALSNEYSDSGMGIISHGYKIYE
jgi:predicted O-methyltransferase YrrM